MTYRKLITQERLKQLFSYDDGNLIRRVPRGRRHKGEVVGCKTSAGYLIVTVEWRAYLVHRLIFLYHHGYYPESEVDHIDRDTLNNRIENLREISHRCNLRNVGIRVSNTSGVTGVSWNKQTKKWKAEICINARNIFLKEVEDFVEAVAHRLAAEQAENWEGCNSTSPAYLFMQKYLNPEDQELEDL